MSRRRLLAAVVLTGAMVAVLGVIVYVERLNATQTVSVFIVRGPVPAGGAYSDDSVQAVQIRAQDGDFAYERRPPSEYRARFATALHPGDILRSDDLIPYDQEVEISLTVSGSPPLNPGDTVDVYATFNGSSVLLGRRLRVTSPGPALTLLVPARDEAAWVAVSSSSTPFHAVRSDGLVATNRSITADEALRLLCGPACATSTGGGSRSLP